MKEEKTEMAITIIRHGKVDMQWRQWCTSEQFDKDCSNYDSSPICLIDEKIEKNIEDDIYISTLKRSRETAEQLFGEKEFIESDLLNEVPLRSCMDCKISLPLWFWNILGRLQWMLGSNRQLEGKKETRKRAKQLIERLLLEDKNCILISHGFFMGTLVNELKQYGFTIGKRKQRFSNLERIIAEKKGKL